MKKITKSKAKQKAWKTFSEYIRRSNADSLLGTLTCYTCGKVDFWNKLQAGHGIGGRNNSILFCEDLVRPQCVGCNVFGRGQYAKFTRKLIDELGLARYDELNALAGQILQLKVSDYQEIEQKYKDKLKEMGI